MVSQRARITVLVFWLVAVLAYVSYAQNGSDPSQPGYVGDFRIAVEPGYSNTADGIQFIALQRIESKEIDRAVLSIDADLPLAKYLLAAKAGRVRITIAQVQPTELQKLVR